MVALRISLLFVSFITTVRANPVFRIPSGFVSKGPAAADTQLNLRIALVQSDTAGLEAALLDVSTPSSANYGKHLSMDEVEAFVRPSVDTVAKVKDWLSTNGLQSTTISPAGDWLSVSMPVKQANELLQADFTVFAHQETGKQTIRTLSYSIPLVLQGHLDLVHPTITFPKPRTILPVFSSPIKSVSNMSSTAVPASCASSVTPACLQALYGIPTTKATQSSNTLGVSGFLDQFANQADLTTFLKNLRPDISSTTTFTLQTLDGGRNPQSPKQAGIEANLDIQYTVGVASGVPVTFISVGDDFQDGNLEGFLDIINFLLGEPNPPQVMYAYVHAPTDYTASNPSVEICRVGTVNVCHLGRGVVYMCVEGVCERRLATDKSNFTLKRASRRDGQHEVKGTTVPSPEVDNAGPKRDVFVPEEHLGQTPPDMSATEDPAAFATCLADPSMISSVFASVTSGSSSAFSTSNLTMKTYLKLATCCPLFPVQLLTVFTFTIGITGCAPGLFRFFKFITSSILSTRDPGLELKIWKG
ncbi:hypothetical protein BD410DRAFT_807518 [Rickenella mellea]|uniref:Peptidase S53 domain-containing protein n=1 Tax=Rickenella mellea TaxID=50990 RepID=A0A4Y7PP11_9AGAM|nr:hypothetical protein BD410DRAFT_807518 [Rickenella mellea]